MIKVIVLILVTRGQHISVDTCIGIRPQTRLLEKKIVRTEKDLVGALRWAVIHRLILEGISDMVLI